MSDLSRLAPSHVRAIAPYQPGKPIGELARELDLDPAGIVKLASNENPQGLSPRVKAALVAALDDIARKGEKALVFLESLDLQDATQLPTILARRYGLKRLPMIINGEVGTDARQQRVDAGLLQRPGTAGRGVSNYYFHSCSRKLVKRWGRKRL